MGNINGSTKKLNPWFVTGFAEGESTFTFSRTGIDHFNLYFAIKLTKSEERLIQRLQEFFNVGKIYQVKARAPKMNSGYTKAALYYRVSTFLELKEIIYHFDRYPLEGQKAKNYEVWKEMWLLKKKNWGRRKWLSDDLKKINELAKKLSLSSSRNLPWDGFNQPK